jgi:hypothetical protein
MWFPHSHSKHVNTPMDKMQSFVMLEVGGAYSNRRASQG